MKKKLLAMLLAGAMLISIAACNDDGDTNTTTTTGDGTTTDAADTTANSSSGDGDIKITVYTFSDEMSDLFIPFVQEKHSTFSDTYTVDIIMEATATTYIQKVESALDSGTGIDLYNADADYARRFASNSKTASLADAGIEINESDYYAYTLDMMRVGGEVKGISHQATPGGMYYRTDLAKDILGIETPEEMQAEVSTWDGFLKVADALKEEGIYMTYGTDELKRNFLNARNEGWVVDGKLSIDETTIKEFFEVTNKLYGANEVVYKGTGQWSSGWQAAARGAGVDDDGNDTTDSVSAFAYFGCTWYLHYCLKGWTIADDSEVTDDTTDEELVGNGTFGSWGLVDGPASFFWGGTYWFVPQHLVDAANDGDEEAVKKLEGVRTIIETICVDDDTVKEYALNTGDFVSKKTVVEAIKDDPAFENVFLGGQNHYVAFASSAEKIDASKNVTTYDATMDEFFNEAINTFFSSIDGGGDFDASYNAAMAGFVENVKGLGDVTVGDYETAFN